MNILRDKRVLIGIAGILVIWIGAMGFHWLHNEPARPTSVMTKKPVSRNTHTVSNAVADTWDSLALPTSVYPDDVYVKELKKPITTTSESMAIRAEDSYRAKVLQFLVTGTRLEYQGIRTRMDITLEIAGKRVPGYWLKVRSNSHEGWIFSPGTDYSDE